MNKDILSRCLPFIVYMAFVGVQEFLGWAGYGEGVLLFLYPLKILLVGATLLFMWRSYDELGLKGFNISNTVFSFSIGIAVFILWINMDWPFAIIGELKGFDPNSIEGGGRNVWIAVRMFGAAMIVPVMEEIFWRSFLLRYIIKPDFKAVAIGQYTLSSFVISTVLFGLEHNMFLAGMMAGAAYNIVLYRTKSVPQCILAHAMTNLLLGIYVIYTNNWQFW